MTSLKSANSVEIGTVLAMFCLQKTEAEMILGPLVGLMVQTYLGVLWDP